MVIFKKHFNFFFLKIIISKHILIVNSQIFFKVSFFILLHVPFLCTDIPIILLKSDGKIYLSSFFLKYEHLFDFYKF